MACAVNNKTEESAPQSKPLIFSQHQRRNRKSKMTGTTKPSLSSPASTKQMIHNTNWLLQRDSGALSVHDRGTRLIVLLLLNPHLLERRQRRQNGASDPDRVLPLRRSDDFDRHRVGSQLLFDVADDLLLGRRGEGVSSLRQNLLHILRDVASGQIKA